MAKKSRKRGFKKMYVSDDCTEWVWVQVEDARWPVEFTMVLDKLFIEASRRGVPWKCLLSIGIQEAARKDPTLFRHPVKYPYAEGTHVFIVARIQGKRGPEHPLAFRYRHNFTKALRQFDEITKAQFLEQFGEKGVEIRLVPPHRRRHTGEHAVSREQPARKPTEREAGEKRLRGAARRARDAGLLNVGTVVGGPPPT